jgi:hypothetical protein
MTDNRIGRAITNSLQPYWNNHPNQRDFFHGLYHQFMADCWKEAGNYEEAEKDLKRRDDHWLRHENQRQYENRTGRRHSNSPK